MKVEGATDPYPLVDGARPTSSHYGRSDSLFNFYSADQSDGSEDNVPDAASPRRGTRPPAKSSGACVHCKSLKVRCEFSPGQKTCQRCQAGNYECIPRSRKKRKPAPTHEDLQLRAHQQDAQIYQLLAQFDTLKANNRIRDRMTRTEHNGSKRTNYPDRFENLARGDSPTELQVIAAFAPTQAHEPDLPRLTPPDIVRFCSLTPNEIDDLFTIFFERINPFFSILDQELHTPAALIWTCPFLFTVICSTAARYYASRPTLYSSAQDFARDASAKSLIEGPRTIDVCQAYLLMALYPPPKKKWEEDRRWILMGVAIRVALELELDKPLPSCGERESLNRTRTWLNCFCVDGSHSIQFGKMPMIRLDDHMALHSQNWYCSSQMNQPFDVHLCAYVQIIVIMARWRKEMEGNLRQRIRDGFNVVKSAIETEESLDREMNRWASLYDEQYSYNLLALAICLYRGDTTRLITAYLRLVVLAAGFQHAVRHTNLTRDSEILKRSIDAAKSVIEVTVKRLYPTGNLRYAMEANFVYVSFAAAYLVNLLRPKFLHLVREEVQRDIVAIVTQLVKILASDKVALDGRHTPLSIRAFWQTLWLLTKWRHLYRRGNFHQSTQECTTRHQLERVILGQTSAIQTPRRVLTRLRTALTTWIWISV
ncbi:hypothetical protein BDZ89DRAFT_976137 [Hymenopellis radicata]|nr:hypothetical protein BDZ89DRAFT_976137 [Hymenopellis radicata]